MPLLKTGIACCFCENEGTFCAWEAVGWAAERDLSASECAAQGRELANGPRLVPPGYVLCLRHQASYLEEEPPQGPLVRFRVEIATERPNNFDCYETQMWRATRVSALVQLLTGSSVSGYEISINGTPMPPTLTLDACNVQPHSTLLLRKVVPSAQ